MQISSYTFQSPYPQAVQVGRPDPSTAKEEEKPSEILENKDEMQTIEAKVSATKESDVNTLVDPLPQEKKPSSKEQFNSLSVPVGFGISIPMGALQDGGSQSSVDKFKSLSVSAQGQKAYAQEAVL